MQIRSSRRLGKRIVRHWQLYVFLLLPVVYFLIFRYVPLCGLQIAFRKYTARGGIWGSEWVGMKNFLKFFKSYQFERVISNTLRLSFYSLIAGFPLPIIFALALNSMLNERYKKVLQLVTYAPYFISTTVLVGMLMAILNPRTGLYATIYSSIFGTYPSDLFAKVELFPHLYVWSGVWQNLGWDSIIYVAALSSVAPELHEAAQIDGASRFQRVMYVDLPTILPTASILLILSFGSIMDVGFEKVFLMQNKINLRFSETISTYLYKVGLTSGSDYSLSTAIGLFNSVVNLILLMSVNTVTKKLSGTNLF
ncbi:MAG: ABC transporter permease subunit [Clostridia bacterium]|nr:ABC transporter permease subunit [Clostridia bacterium]MDD6041974.1 ABC transporter permease subunit [Clostridia bacterium]